MNVTGYNHVAINAKNFEESLRFYRDVLGFKELNSVVTDDFVATYLAVPGGGRIELFDLRGKAREIQKTDDDIGPRHIAFTVVDVPFHEKALCEAGVEIVMPCTELENFNARVVLFKDPNDIVLEFCEDLK